MEGRGHGQPPGDDRQPPGDHRVYHLLVDAVRSIMKQSTDARRAYSAMRERGRTDAEAREEIARVLLGVMYHVGGESDRLHVAGGGAGLRAECLRRLAGGETASQIFAD